MKFDVFLCHNSSDKEAVKRIGEQLKAAGLKPWLDEWELPPGRPWQKALEEQIATIGAAAIFVGPDGFGPWQDQEKDAFLRQFVKRSCPVIPVILAECQNPPQLPIFLEAFTWVDFRKAEPPPLNQLVWGITGKKPDPVLPVAKERPTLPLNNLPTATLGDLFKGREDLLAELEKNLDPNTPTALVQAKTLSGLGGVGKTRLAIEYAYRKAAHFKAIFFVNADNEAELRRNFAGLAGRKLTWDCRRKHRKVFFSKRFRSPCESVRAGC